MLIRRVSGRIHANFYGGKRCIEPIVRRLSQSCLPGGLEFRNLFLTTATVVNFDWLKELFESDAAPSGRFVVKPRHVAIARLTESFECILELLVMLQRNCRQLE